MPYGSTDSGTLGSIGSNSSGVTITDVIEDLLLEAEAEGQAREESEQVEMVQYCQ